MKKYTTLFFFCFLLVSTSSWASVMSQMKLIRSNEPSLLEIVKVSIRILGSSSDHHSKWKKRINRSALMPTIYVGYDHQLKTAESETVTDNISVASGIVTVGPQDNNYDFDSNTGKVFRVRAVWELDQLVFNRQNFQLSREMMTSTKINQDVRKIIFEVYDKRYLFLSQYLQFKSRQPQKAIVYYVRYLNETDRLDMLTNGQFTEKFWREK